MSFVFGFLPAGPISKNERTMTCPGRAQDVPKDEPKIERTSQFFECSLECQLRVLQGVQDKGKR